MSTFEKNETCVSGAAWMEWREKCSINNCSSATTCELASFGRRRLYPVLVGLDRGLANEYCDAAADPNRAWCMMEAYLYAGHSDQQSEKEGKSYKDQLFAKTQAPNEMEGYLSLIFQRDIPRKIAFGEGLGGIRLKDGKIPKAVTIISADAPRGETGQTFADTLAANQDDGFELSEAAPQSADTSRKHGRPQDDDGSDCDNGDDDGSIFIEPLEQCDDEAIIRIAEGLAATLWNSWDERKHLIFILLVSGQSTSDVMRTGLIDCGQSQLFESASRIRQSIVDIDWGMELGERQRAFLTRSLFAQLSVLADKWLEKSEKREAIISVLMGAEVPKGS